MDIKIKYWTIMICIVLVAFQTGNVQSQCDEKLVDKAISKSGNDALFIREFVLKTGFQGRKKREKTPTLSTNYDVRLNKGIVYRFIVENEANSPAMAFLQLRRNNLILASTYDVDNQQSIDNFDYLCEESGPYQVLFSFVGESTGCAAGAMFAIMQDSLTLAAIMDSVDIQNVIYTGVDNYIDIAASNISDGTLDVSVSRGLIAEESGLYKIRVDEPGKLVVNVVARDRDGKITETFKSEFNVMAPILPTITLSGSSGGIIKKSDLIRMEPRLEIINYRSDLQFKIISFEVSSKITNNGISNMGDNKLNFRQMNLIKDLNSGETFYITNIRIEDSTGKIYQPESLGFIISE